MKTSIFSVEQEAYFQKNKASLLRQVGFAKDQVDFYKKQLKDLDLSKIDSYQDFYDNVPIIDPREFSKYPRRFSSSLPYDFVRHSSSTTGNPKKIFLTKNDIQHWAKAGRLSITPYYKKGMCVSHSRRKEKHYLSALDKSIQEAGGKVMTFDPLDKSELLKCIRKSDIILEYAELIYYISETIKDMPINLDGKEIILSYVGDKLEKNDIQRIKRNFSSIGIRARIYSEYSTSEIGPIGCSFSNDTNLFEIIYKDNVFIEIVDPKTKKPAREGELVATALNRTGSVFVRYPVGDLGEIIFGGKFPLFKLERRNSGIKISSLFFSPDYAFRLIRRKLKCPIFCEITVKKTYFLGIIKIKVVAERIISPKERASLKTYLLKKLDFIDDIDSTMKLEMSFERRIFRASEIRKGFTYNQF